LTREHTTTTTSFSGERYLSAFYLITLIRHRFNLYCLNSETALFVFTLQFGEWPFVKYSAARTVQFAICRPALPVRLHYPRFPTQDNIFLLAD
jgi:hypothetical protein